MFEKKEKKPKRFRILCQEETDIGDLGSFQIWVDTVTGVNYLYRSAGAGFAGGLTVLVDPEGKPIVTAPENVS